MDNKIISKFNFYNYPVDILKIVKIINNLNKNTNTYFLQSANNYAFNLQIKFDNLPNKLIELASTENIYICDIYYLPSSLLFINVMTNNIINLPNSLMKISTLNNNYKKIRLPYKIVSLNLEQNSLFLLRINKNKYKKLIKFSYVYHGSSFVNNKKIDQ